MGMEKEGEKRESGNEKGAGGAGMRRALSMKLHLRCLWEEL
jgi:hypothetical protein